MSKKTILITLITILTTSIYAQKPNWIKFDQRQQLYPYEEYFIGFSSNLKDKDKSEHELFKELKQSAKAELINTVLVTVKSMSTLFQSDINNNISSEFRHAVTSFSEIKLNKAITETHYDKRKKTGYALAYVKKDALIDYYLQTLVHLKLNIAGKINAAEQFISIGDEEDALKAYFECMPLFCEAESAYTIVMALRASKEQISQIYEYETKVKKGIASIYRSDQISLPELCSFMTFGLNMQTGTFEDRIRLGSFTFEDSKMSSQFSRRFINAFEKELIEEANYEISTTASKPGSKPPTYILSGTYWNDAGNLKVIAILRNTITGKPIASAEGYLPISWLNQRNISYKPENFGQAAENMQQFKSNEITNGGMQLQLWTNKGSDSPIFEENDILELYIRTNHECYIRIVDYMADGSKVLLVDNMYIGSDKVNTIEPLLIKFRCTAPFGVEVLQANAQTKEFPPLLTEREYGYDFILDDVDGILSNTRGFKRITNEDLKAESRVVVTTMKDNE